MTIILTDGPPPEPTDSPLADIFDHAFPLADELSRNINESATRMVQENKEFSNMSDVIIVHSVALMLIICMMNREVLETDALEETFTKVKGITEQYIKHLLEMGKDIH